jgi:hypothetical protein
VILLISASLVSRITGVDHSAWLRFLSLWLLLQREEGEEREMGAENIRIEARKHIGGVDVGEGPLEVQAQGGVF